MISNKVLLERAGKYAKSKSIILIRQSLLGYGSDGTVWRTNRDTAVKVLEREENFLKELECYRRFKAREIRHIGIFAVPYLEGFDESLLAIEMTIVRPPYLLDFGKVHLDKPPPYYGDRQLMANAYAEWRDRFGKDWRQVGSAMETLRSQFGIYYVDPRPANICVKEEDEDDDEWMREPSLGPDDF